MHDIADIELSARTYGRSVIPVRVPYVRLRDGGGFWLDALAGEEEVLPPNSDQLELLREIRTTLDLAPA